MVSWEAVATHLADRGAASTVLDHASCIRLFSAPLEAMLGHAREDVEGRTFSDALVAPAVREHVRVRIERALAGTLRAFDCEVTSRDGRKLRLSLEASLVGRREEQGLLLTVASVAPVNEAASPADVDELEYEISSSLADFGRLLSLRADGRPMPPRLDASERCFAVISERGTPCPDCPALRAGADPWPRTVARRARGQVRGYEVVTAESGEDRVRVRLRRITDDTVAAIYDSRVRDLADAASLSERERAVLTYLLMGRSLGDIATILDISPRTVKFHQANVLEKLGADSRADLIRLIT